MARFCSMSGSCAATAAARRGLDGQQLRWLRRAELALQCNGDLLPADRPIVAALRLPQRLRQLSTPFYRFGSMFGAMDADRRAAIARRHFLFATPKRPSGGSGGVGFSGHARGACRRRSPALVRRRRRCRCSRAVSPSSGRGSSARAASMPECDSFPRMAVSISPTRWPARTPRLDALDRIAIAYLSLPLVIFLAGGSKSWLPSL